jgi:hypothetical protein
MYEQPQHAGCEYVSCDITFLPWKASISVRTM